MRVAGPVKAGLRVAAGDPGFKNHGLCVIELTHVDSVVGVQGPRTRTPVPCFKILFLDTLNLVAAVPGKIRASDADHGALAKLHSAMTSAKPDHNNLPLWREHLAQHIVAECPILFERYDCELTGKRELPVLANENQLDVTGEGASPEERAEFVVLARATAQAEAFATAREQTSALAWVRDLVHLAGNGRLQLKQKDDFQRGRMYTLSQIFAGVVEGVDELKRPGMRDRLVINAAKKHAIASDHTLTYAQRKAAAVNLMFDMLEGQANDTQSSADERQNGIKWLAFLRARKAAGQKLDDMADAFLLAIAVALKVHKKFTKLHNPGVVLSCYAPVTNAEIEAAGLLPHSANARVATSEVKKKAAPRKRAPPKKKAAPKKRKREEPSSIAFPSSSDDEVAQVAKRRRIEEAPSKPDSPKNKAVAGHAIRKVAPKKRKREEPSSISFPSSSSSPSSSSDDAVVPATKRPRVKE